MTTDLTTKQETGVIDYSKPQVLKVIRETVAVGATDAEFAMFIQICKSSGLNPFKREIWFIKAGGRVQMMTGINGFTAIANNSPQYDGTELGLVGKNGEYLPMTYPGNDFIGAWAKVYRKDRRFPSEGVAMLSEYDKGQGNWKAMKRVMISKCAESLALRKAFPQELNGLYTQEEMPVEYSELRRVDRTEVTSPTTPQPKPKRPDGALTNDQLADLYHERTGGNARTKPMGQVYEWAAKQPDIEARGEEGFLYRRNPTPQPKEPEVVFEASDELPEEWFAEARHVASEEAGGIEPSQVAFSMDDVEGEPKVWVLNIPYKLSQDETFKKSRRGKLMWNSETKRWTYSGHSLPVLEASDGKVDLLQYVDEEA